MRDNTPPRARDIEEDEGELIHFENDIPPDDDDDDLEMEEVTLEELEMRFGNDDDEDEYDDGAAGTRRSPVQDDAVMTFEKHTSAVFGCSLHPEREWAVTGSEDDHAYVWNIQTGEVLFEVTDHKDTVTEVHFSYDGNYLATADMAGELFVFKIQDSAENNSGIFRKVWEYSMGDMSWMRWHRGANVLMAGSENGEIYVWRIPSGDCKILTGQGERCNAGELTGDGKKLYAAYANGVLKLWDLKSNTVIMQVDEQHPLVHKEHIIAIACDKESPLYMSGDSSGKILFCSNNGPVGTVEASGSIECLAFSPSSEFKMAASGTLHGQIAIWDYAKYTLRTECEHHEMDDGITKLKWISDYTIVVTTIKGHIYGYDARSGARKFKLSGHIADIYDFNYNPREHIALTVSEDHSAKIFRVPQLGD